jgi:SNF2 family DNA or RNA helicase
MLDLIKPRLREAGIPFVELRGDTTNRAEPVRAFEAGEVPLFLISLKAGGRGLNLVSADTVIHYDPWWNPAVEDQASDRAHRIGQTKSVFVYKMIAADTVEERILELQQRKAELAAIAFSEEGENQDAGALSALDSGDIDFLFGSSQDAERQAA